MSPLILIFLSCLSLSAAVPLNTTFKGSSILDEVPLVDGHNDWPYNLYKMEHNQLQNIDLNSDLTQHPTWGKLSASQTDIPRLRRGKVGGQFWVAYVSCDSLDKDAVELTMDQIDVVRRMIKMYSDNLQFTTTSAGIWDAYEKGKIASLIAVEGGHSIDNRLGVLRLYYDMGVRYMTLTHTCTLPWADASPIDDEAQVTKHDLTDWGKKVVLEMNRLGMMVDISHVSKGVMLDVLKTSKAPVIFSHSSAWAIKQHHRNVQDDVLLELKKNNGIIMVNFYPTHIGGTTMDKVIEHLNHIRKVLNGTDNIGIGADYDGVSETPKDLADVSKYPDLFDRLAEDGHGYEPWSENDLKKLAGLNLIRVFRQVEAVRDSLQKELPYDTPIPYEDLTRDNPTQGCRTDLEKYRKQYQILKETDLYVPVELM